MTEDLPPAQPQAAMKRGEETADGGRQVQQQPWFWQHVLEDLKRPDQQFLNRDQARVWMGKAEEAERQKNLPKLRDAVVKIWELLPPDQVQRAKEQAAQSGLRSM